MARGKVTLYKKLSKVDRTTFANSDPCKQTCPQMCEMGSKGSAGMYETMKY